jgi:predicted DNA-binding protein YlxM (UPF0122 family)
MCTWNSASHQFIRRIFSIFAAIEMKFQFTKVYTDKNCVYSKMMFQVNKNSQTLSSAAAALKSMHQCIPLVSLTDISCVNI